MLGRLGRRGAGKTHIRGTFLSDLAEEVNRCPAVL